MRIVLVMVALFAILGMAASTVYDITILAPVDGEIFEYGSKIYVNTECNADGNGMVVARILVDGIRSYSDILRY